MAVYPTWLGVCQLSLPARKCLEEHNQPEASEDQLGDCLGDVPGPGAQPLAEPEADERRRKGLRRDDPEEQDFRRLEDRERKPDGKLVDRYRECGDGELARAERRNDRVVAAAHAMGDALETNGKEDGASHLERGGPDDAFHGVAEEDSAGGQCPAKNGKSGGDGEPAVALQPG